MYMCEWVWQSNNRWLHVIVSVVSRSSTWTGCRYSSLCTWSCIMCVLGRVSCACNEPTLYQVASAFVTAAKFLDILC